MAKRSPTSSAVRAARAAVIAASEAKAAEFVVVPAFDTMIGADLDGIPQKPPALNAGSGLPHPDDGLHLPATRDDFAPLRVNLDPKTHLPIKFDE
jgi:hypothetical protein